VFRVSPPPPLGNTKGGIYIGVFRSSCESGDEDRRHQRSEGQTALGGAAWPGARATCAHLGLVAFLVYFSCSRRFS
jgi:hypothetical protein